MLIDEQAVQAYRSLKNVTNKNAEPTACPVVEWTTENWRSKQQQNKQIFMVRIWRQPIKRAHTYRETTAPTVRLVSNIPTSEIID